MRRQVVFEIRGDLGVTWAWCLSDGGAGFESISFTKDDGLTVIDGPEVEDLHLGRYLFSVPAPRPAS